MSDGNLKNKFVSTLYRYATKGDRTARVILEGVLKDIHAENIVPKKGSAISTLYTHYAKDSTSFWSDKLSLSGLKGALNSLKDKFVS